MTRLYVRLLVALAVAGCGVAAAARLHLSAASSPLLLVLNKGNLTMVTADPSTLKVIDTFPSGPDPHEVIASPDGSTAYITNYTQGGTISVVDLIGKKALAPIEIAPLARPHGLDIDGGKLYFTAEGSKVVGRVDLATRKVDWVIGTGQDRTHMVLASTDGKRLITTNVSSASVSFIEQVELANARGAPVIDWRVTTVPAGRGAEGNDLSPDGRELWVLNAQDRSVTIIDAINKKVLQTTAIPANAGNRLKFTRDGKHVFISDLRGPDLLVLDVPTRKEAKRINMGEGAGSMAGILMEPSGSRTFVSVGAKNFVAVIDTRTLTMIGKIESGPGPDGLAWAAPR